MRDRAFLEEGRVRARIGVTEAERSEPQQLIIDLSWTVGTGDVAQDELSEVIDYTVLSVVIQNLAGPALRTQHVLECGVAVQLRGGAATREVAVEDEVSGHNDGEREN